MDLTKTIQTELIGITNVAASAQSISSAFSSEFRLAAMVFIDIAPEATNTPGTELRVELSQKSSGNDTWVPFWTIITSKATLATSGVDGVEAAGSTLIEEAAAGPGLGAIVFFKNGTIANSEWSRVVAVNAGVSFTIQDGLTNAQTGATWFNQAERFAIPIDLTAINRFRVICNNNFGAGAVAVNWRVALITADSIE